MHAHHNAPTTMLKAAVAVITLATATMILPVSAAPVALEQPKVRAIANWAKKAPSAKKKDQTKEAPVVQTKVAAKVVAKPEVDVPADASRAEKVIAHARSLIGTPYRWAGSSPAGFDCSGFTQYVFSKVGIELPHNSSAQRSVVTPVPLDDLRPGDLVFSGWNRIGHVGLYIGDGKMIHSPQTGRSVEIAPVRRNLQSAGRPTA